MRIKLAAVVAGLALVSVVTLSAHHSFSAVFDASKTF